MTPPFKYSGSLAELRYIESLFYLNEKLRRYFLSLQSLTLTILNILATFDFTLLIMQQISLKLS